MTRMLVTGGAGFIGSTIVDQLIARGVEVEVIDNLDPAAHGDEPSYLNPAATYHWSDVRDVGAWRAVMARGSLDAICHQAGKVGLGVDFADVDAYVDHNDAGMAAGLRALHDGGFAGRFVLASSMVVYGEGRYRCAEHGLVRPGPRAVTALDAGQFEPCCPVCAQPLTAEAIDESAPLEPRNVYAATKLHQEHLLQAFAREHPVSTVALRYHNVYGPRMPFDTPYAGVASIFRSALERGVAPRVTEDGGQLRNFVHVGDVARANVVALLDSDATGAFNVAAQRPLSVGAMAEVLARASGAEPGHPLWPIVTGGYRLGDVRHVFASPDKAAAELGFVAATDPADGLVAFAGDPLRRATGGNGLG